MCQYGLTLALQTENPETLKAINRRNVSDAEIDDAVKWASNPKYAHNYRINFWSAL